MRPVLRQQIRWYHVGAAAITLLALAPLACRDEGPSTSLPTAVAPAVVAAGSQVLVGAGDIADCRSTGDEATAALLDSIPGTVFTAGDNVYPNGTAAEFANCYDPSWGRHRARTRPATGNHDYNTPGAAGYFGYFGAAAGDPTKGYYSYDLGAWHIVVLNSSIDITATSPQLAWLRGDLAASGARCTAAIWHHPRFSSGANYGSSTKFQPAWQILWEAGADVVVVGHEHFYERFAPQRPNGDPDFFYGIRQFVVGVGGEHGSPWGAIARNSQVRDSSAIGILKLTLDSAGYAWQFIPAVGTFADAGTGSCHGAPPPGVPPIARPGGPYVTADGTVHFNGGSSVDPDRNYPLSFSWDFGDGNTNSSGATPTHTYTADGTFTVRLVVTDARGSQSAVAVTTVNVARTNQEIVFAGAGNIARCSNDNDEVTARLLDALPGFVFSPGDHAFPNGTAANFRNCYDANWGRHRTRTFPALGNHEYDSSSTADAMFDYFGGRAGPRGLGYYSADLGDWHVIVLNDNGTRVPFAAGSAQDQWLQADLAANTRRCTMAIWHTPLFLSTNTAGYTENSSRRTLWNRLFAVGVDLVVNANQHHYERMTPMRPDGVRYDIGGIRQFNVGTGGESLDLPTVAVHPNSEVRAAVYGVLKLTLRAGSYDWQFLAIPGLKFTDAGAAPCHGGTLPNQPPSAVPGGPYTTSDGTVHFNGAASTDPDGNVPLTYRWDFGDGNTNDGQAPSHTYTADGTYTVTLTVTDARGASSAPATTTVSVNRTATYVVVSGAGNIAKCSNNNDQATAQILDTLPGFVVTLGDNAFPNGRLADFQGCYHPTWGRHLTRTFPVLGNHDYDSSSTAAGAFDYFGARAGTRGLGYYSLNVGAWHVIVLNDNGSFQPYAAGSVQDQWLVSDLATSGARCTIALWHTPLFLSSDTPGYTENASRRTLWNRLFAAGADVVLNGNQHHYERMAPMRPDGTRDDTTGIRQFNVGTGGESVGPPTTIHSNSEARDATYGVLRLTLHADRYDWQFVTAGGTVSDAGSGTCR